MNTDWILPKPWIHTLVFALALILGAAPGLRAGKRERAQPTANGEFFVVSSVDVKQKLIVLKRPAEVTEFVRVSDKTVFLDAKGNPFRFQDLRAGDTVYVTSSTNSEGVKVATRVRKGPMTVEELHRRYLKE